MGDRPVRTLALVTVLSAAACAAPARQVTATAPATTTTAKRWIPAAIVPATTTTTVKHWEHAVTVPAPLGGVWLRLRECESGDNYSENTGNGFFGAYQFDRSTFDAQHTGYARADLAPYWVQDQAAERLHAERGWQPWPVCGPRAAA